jgi:hypothetical protein
MLDDDDGAALTIGLYTAGVAIAARASHVSRYVVAASVSGALR